MSGVEIERRETAIDRHADKHGNGLVYFGGAGTMAKSTGLAMKQGGAFGELGFSGLFGYALQFELAARVGPRPADFSYKNLEDGSKVKTEYEDSRMAFQVYVGFSMGYHVVGKFGVTLGPYLLAGGISAPTGKESDNSVLGYGGQLRSSLYFTKRAGVTASLQVGRDNRSGVSELAGAPRSSKPWVLTPTLGFIIGKDKHRNGADGLTGIHGKQCGAWGGSKCQKGDKAIATGAILAATGVGLLVGALVNATAPSGTLSDNGEDTDFGPDQTLVKVLAGSGAGLAGAGALTLTLGARARKRGKK